MDKYEPVPRKKLEIDNERDLGRTIALAQITEHGFDTVRDGFNRKHPPGSRVVVSYFERGFFDGICHSQGCR